MAIFGRAFPVRGVFVSRFRVDSSVSLAPALFSDGDTFYSATVTPGAVTLTPSLFTDADTFYSATVSQSGVLLPSLFVDPDTFYSATVAPGSVTLTPSLFVDGDTFYSATVSATYGLTPSLYNDADTFYVPIVAASYSLVPSLFVDGDAFYTPTISTSGNVTLLPSLFVDADVFYSATVTTVGGVTTNPLENLKMYTGSLGAVSNREDWIVNITLVGADGTLFDITQASEIETFVCPQGCPNSPVLSASLDDGITLTDANTLQWAFDADEMSALCAAQYDVFARVTINSIVTQMLSASIAIIEGGPR